MSRYSTAVTSFDDAGRAFIPARRADPVDRVEVLTVTVRQPERVDLLAHDYADDAREWHRVMALNPEYLIPTDIPVGHRARVPR